MLARIATPAAEQVLMESLLEPDTDSGGLGILVGLSVSARNRSFQILGTLEEDLNSEEAVARALRQSTNLSPDGSRVAVDISDLAENNVDVWLESTSGVGNTRFTFSPEEDVVGVWSRDGRTLAYRENLPAHSALITKRASGLEREQIRFEVSASDDIVPNSWSVDGRKILTTHASPSGTHLLLVPLAKSDPTPFAVSKGNEMNGQISPDGKWAAYASDESGTWQIYVTTFPDAVGKFQVSRGGGTEPRWNRGGKEIFYLSPRGVLTSVSVDTTDTFSTGAPQPLFQIRSRAAISATDHFSHDVAGDGKRFLVNQYLKPEHVDPLTILLHADTIGQKSIVLVGNRGRTRFRVKIVG